MRIRLHPGVWSIGSSIVLAGGGALTAANTTQTALQFLGYAALALGVGLLVWGITVDGEHWWKRLPRLRLPGFSRGRMYVGQILVSDSLLDGLHTLSLTVRGYNGTGRDRIFLGASGSVKLGYSLNGTGSAGIDMAPPGLVDPPSRIAADSEFHIDFQQPLTPEQTAFFRQWEAQGADIQMMFDGLASMTRPARLGSPERLALWNGISLRNGRFYGEIVCVTAHSTARLQVTPGGRN